MPTRWLLLALLAVPAQAAPRLVPLAPPATRIDFTTYALGLFPLPGQFMRFTGSLAIDPEQPDTCAVWLDVEAASLAMASPVRTQLATGPHLLDAATFPRIAYRGSCADGLATGSLALHGITRPITLHIVRQATTVSATGNLRRQDYGIAGLPGLLGHTIRIDIAIALPPELARR